MGWYALWEHHELAALTDSDPVSEVVLVEVHDLTDCKVALKIWDFRVVFSWSWR